LKCPTGEKVPVKFRSLVKVELRKYSSKKFVYMTEIKEDCIVGADFFCERNGGTKFLDLLF